MATEDILTSLGIDPMIADEPFARDDAGHLVDPTGTRVVLVAAETTRGFHRILEAEQPGAWSVAMKDSGCACGRKIATALDASLARLGKPVLTALPLEACLALLEHSVAAYGWGRLQIDLSEAADHGFVVARLEHSHSVETLADADGFVDAMLAGILQGFFGHVSGQNLECEEIACARFGSPHCTFVITSPERLATVTPEIGRETPEALLARLRQ
jgi:predicted hydrocarbon binding protein